MAMNTLLAQRYLEHLVKAGTRHAVHSPFVFTLVEEVLRPDHGPENALHIEALRKALLRRNDTITVTDLGAGTHRRSGPERRISTIARHALKPTAQARLLYRLARHCSCRTALELGTSFGISTLYLAAGSEQGTVHTLEGCPNTLALAREQFAALGATNIHAHSGAFADRLPDVLADLASLDLVFIDGHHAEAPTLAYFEQCLTKAHENTVFVLDDIHWSAGMERAWERIKEHARVTVTVDLFHLGLVFLRPGQAREHFRLRY